MVRIHPDHDTSGALMFVRRTAAVAATALVAVVGLAAGVHAATPSAKAPAPPLANTQQTERIPSRPGGPPKVPVAVDFAASTFTIPAFGDSGTFTETGTSVSLKITSKTQDKGCLFTATYKPASTRFSGSYTCPHNAAQRFTLTTAG